MNERTESIGRSATTGEALKVTCVGQTVESVDPVRDTPDLPSMIPPFVDNHCHILPTGLDLLKPHLGACDSREEVLDLVREAAANSLGNNWLHVVYYDQTRFGDGMHITLEQLDAISTTQPILLRHANGHASVANSAALKASGVGPDTPDPSGGQYGRNADGSLNGLLLETAHERVTDSMPCPTEDQMVEAIVRAAQSMLGYGIVCATDMMTGRFDLERELKAYKRAADLVPFAFRLCIQWSAMFGPKRLDPGLFHELNSAMNPKTCRVFGIKLFADGAVSSATAAIHGEFLTGGNGKLIYSPEELSRRVRIAHDAGYSVAIHSIGDRSTDVVIDAYEALGDCRMHRIEHVMLLSDAQIERLARMGCHVTLQPEFMSRLGHAYQRQLGSERASKLFRIASIERAGIPFSLSSDRPIVPGDPWDGIAAAVQRPIGFEPSEAISPESAVKAYTVNGSRGNHDGDQFGDFAVGSWGRPQMLKTTLQAKMDGRRSTRSGTVGA